jgi:acetyl/propionyl-CoA carboxylase alpha subunit
VALSLRRVLVANRGEVAVRIVRACHALGLEAVVACSDADATSVAVEEADGSVRLGPPPAADSYLSVPRVVRGRAPVGLRRGAPRATGSCRSSRIWPRPAPPRA